MSSSLNVATTTIEKIKDQLESEVVFNKKSPPVEAHIMNNSKVSEYISINTPEDDKETIENEEALYE